MQPGEFTPLRENQSIGMTKDGVRALRIDTEAGRFFTPLPNNAGPEDMVMYGLAAQMMSGLYEMNMAGVFFPGRSGFEIGGGRLEIRMPDDFNRAQRLCQIFYGGMVGYNGELLDQSDLDRIPYLMQFQNKKGDAVIGDANPEQMLADYRQQGLLDDDNRLNWKRFSGMVEANRSGLFGSEQNFSQAG